MVSRMFNCSTSSAGSFMPFCSMPTTIQVPSRPCLAPFFSPPPWTLAAMRLANTNAVAMSFFMKDLRNSGETTSNKLAAGNRSDNQKRLRARGNWGGQGSVRRIVGKVLFAGVEAQERTALFRDMIANRAAQHGIARFEGIEDRALSDRAGDFELHFAVDGCQGLQMIGKNDADHGQINSRKDAKSPRFVTISSSLRLRARLQLVQRLHFNRHHCRQMFHDRQPVVAAVGRAIYFAAGRAEVDAALVERIDGRRFAQDVHVTILLRQALGERLPLGA